MKKEKIVPVLLLLLGLFLTGCAGRTELELYTRASQLLEAGEYEEAREAFEDVAVSGSYQAEAYRGIGLSYMAEGIYPEASIALERALLRLDADDAELLRDIRLYLAYCRTMQGEKEKAMELYDTLLAEKEDAEILFLRGNLRMESGREDEARQDFERAVTIGNSCDLYIRVFQIYKSRGKSADGTRLLESALAVTDQEGVDDFYKGKIHYYLQNYDRAAQELLSAIEQDPENSEAVLMLGRVYLATDSAAEARALFRAHLISGKESAALYEGLALCDMAEGKFEDALENLREGLALEDKTATRGLRYYEILVYEQLHDWEEAKEAAAEFMLLYPTDEAGQKELQFLESR